jgi:transposase
LWALEDCPLLTPWLDRQLLGLGEELARVSPKLTVPERPAGRTRGKSDPIDALAVARAALREPDLPRPQAEELVHRELKLLVHHRDDRVDERRRTQQRLRRHLHELDPTLVVPLRRLDRASQLERVGRWLARREQEVQVRIARELVARCRSLTRSIDELNQELEQRAANCRVGAARAAGLRRRDRGEAARRDRPDQPLQKRRATGPPQRRRAARASSGKSQRRRLDRGGNRQLNAALYRIAITQSRYHPAARAYLERKRAEGKTRREAIRCLKRLLARAVYNTLKTSPALT